jgi:small subunit ribosomal protein S21
MLGIEVRAGEDINRAVKRFSNLCERNGLMSDMRRGRYEKPSAVKRKKKNKVLHDRKKQLKKQNKKFY